MKKLYLSFVAIIYFFVANGDVDRQLIQSYLNSYSEKTSFKLGDVSNWEITDSHVDKRNGIQFVYIRQKIDGIPVQNGLANFAIKNRQIYHTGNRLISDLRKKLPSASPSINPEVAIKNAVEQLNLALPSNLSLVNQKSEREFLFSKGNISLEDIPVELMYIQSEDGIMHLVWDLSIYELSAENWWSVTIDAHNGELINKVNWVTHCDFGHAHTANEGFNDKNQNIITQSGNNSSASNSLTSSEYRVIALPAESPNHGPYVLVTDPGDSVASPFGWHDTDGTSGPEYTITRGNNVHAYEDTDGSNSNNPGNSPDGGSSLIFDFPYTPGTAPSSYEDAAITNLFYMNNEMHDIWYQYGFDEASGNFQENNYGNGGFGSDYVRAEAQDGGGSNNANFATPTDGNRPRMQMYLWGTGNSARDGDFDNGIIAHEYGHGISNRLTGGASQSGCLSNDEQMGEGWSDWFGLMITIDSLDQGTDRRGIGTFAVNQTTNGVGIRPAPYSTDFSENDYTYGNSNSGVSRPHGVGFVFATALWDLNWALINQYGGAPDPDIYNGTGGNNIAMNLITTGLKLQPCSPGMIDGRDAILAADSLLYNGQHQCLIWSAFANRGFGFFADQGSQFDRSDQTEDFQLSPICLTISQAPVANFGVDQQNPICGLDLTFIDSSLNISQQWFWDFGDGTTSTQPRPKHLYPNPGTYIAKLVVSNSAGIDSISKTINIGQPSPPVVDDVIQCPGQVVLRAPLGLPGVIEWLDLNLNVLRTGPTYPKFVTNDEIVLVRRVTANAGPSCISTLDTVYINILNSDFSYNQVGNAINFTDASSNATSWLWDFGDGNSSTLQNPSHTYLSAGNYDVTLEINGEPCNKTETISFISAINEENQSSRFSFYPNPTKGSIIVSLKEDAGSETYYSVQDLQGKTIIRNRIPVGQKSIEVNLNGFESAMYLIQIEGEDFIEVRKLLLEK